MTIRDVRQETNGEIDRQVVGTQAHNKASWEAHWVKAFVTDFGSGLETEPAKEEGMDDEQDRTMELAKDRWSKYTASEEIVLELDDQQDRGRDDDMAGHWLYRSK